MAQNEPEISMQHFLYPYRRIFKGYDKTVSILIPHYYDSATAFTYYHNKRLKIEDIISDIEENVRLDFPIAGVTYRGPKEAFSLRADQKIAVEELFDAINLAMIGQPRNENFVQTRENLEQRNRHAFEIMRQRAARNQDAGPRRDLPQVNLQLAVRDSQININMRRGVGRMSAPIPGQGQFNFTAAVHQQNNANLNQVLIDEESEHEESENETDEEERENDNPLDGTRQSIRSTVENEDEEENINEDDLDEQMEVEEEENDQSIENENDSLFVPNAEDEENEIASPTPIRAVAIPRRRLLNVTPPLPDINSVFLTDAQFKRFPEGTFEMIEQGDRGNDRHRTVLNAIERKLKQTPPKVTFINLNIIEIALAQDEDEKNHLFIKCPGCNSWYHASFCRADFVFSFGMFCEHVKLCQDCKRFIRIRG